MTPESQPFPPPPVSDDGFPMLAIAILGITATAFLLISYYIFLTKCCFRWQLIDPLRRFSHRARVNEDPSTSYSPSWQSRGLNDLVIREIPTLQYNMHDHAESSNLSKCVVCLNKFQHHDMLRLLPKCNHAFHLDCIDVWLMTNSNCPLCRSAISGRNRYRLDSIVAPNSSPQDPHVTDEEFHGTERVDSSRKSKTRKVHHFSIMGDEGINVGEKDDQFSIEPIRRSFSMDSAGDRLVYLSVHEIVQQNRQLRNSEESSSRSRRSIFSFGQSRGSKNALLPY